MTCWRLTWRAKGLRSTEQRRLIVETFFHSHSHITIEELLGQVRSADPRVGYATVYRTLKLLAESGVANERHFGDGVTRYELADGDTHHDHLICIECHGITEFEEPRIESLQDEVARAYGFDSANPQARALWSLRRLPGAGAQSTQLTSSGGTARPPAREARWSRNVA